MFFTHDRAFEELFGICIQLLNKTWKEMRATAEDFNKVRVTELCGHRQRPPVTVCDSWPASGESLSWKTSLFCSIESQGRGIGEPRSSVTLNSCLPLGAGVSSFAQWRQYLPPPVFLKEQEDKHSNGSCGLLSTYCVQELLQFWELGMSGRGQRDRDVRVMGVILEASRGPVSVEHRWALQT